MQAAAPEFARLRQFEWFSSWFERLQAGLSPNGFWPSAWGLALLILPWVFASGLLAWIFTSVFYGIFGFGFGLAVLFFCMGPRDWREDLDELIHAYTPEQRRHALHAFAVGEGAAQSTPALIEPVLAAALKRQFAPIFWFVCFGPAGAVGYRLVQLAADSAEIARSAPAGLVEAAKHWEAALAWIPAQLMCASLALASDFDAAARAWKEHHDRHGRGILDLDLGFLASTVKACIDLDDVDEPADAGLDTVALQHTQRLVGRITLAWLLALSILVLAAYLT